MNVTFKQILKTVGISLEQFKQEYWGKKSLFISKGVTNCKNFFSKEDFELALNNNAPWNWGATKDILDEEDAAQKSEKGNPVLENMSCRQAKVLRELGLYLLVRNPEVTNENIANFIGDLNTELRAMTKRFEVILFQGSQGKGLSLHNDPIEIFVLQLSGKKKWTYSDRPFPLSTVVFKDRDRGFYITNGSREGELIPHSRYPQNYTSLIMQPGDFLYLPAFTLHETSNDSDYTLSLSMMRENQPYINSVQTVMQELNAEAWFEHFDRSDIPSSFMDLKTHICEKIKSLHDFVNSQDVDFFSQIFASYSKTHTVNTFINENRNIKVEISENSVVQKNPKLIAQFVDNTDSGLLKRNLYIDGKEYSFDDVKWFKFAELIISGESFIVRDLLQISGLSGEFMPELLDNLSAFYQQGAIIVLSIEVSPFNERAAS